MFSVSVFFRCPFVATATRYTHLTFATQMSLRRKRATDLVSRFFHGLSCFVLRITFFLCGSLVATATRYARLTFATQILAYAASAQLPSNELFSSLVQLHVWRLVPFPLPVCHAAFCLWPGRW